VANDVSVRELRNNTCIWRRLNRCALRLRTLQAIHATYVALPVDAAVASASAEPVATARRAGRRPKDPGHVGSDERYRRAMELHEIGAANWQACAAIRPALDQERFVAPVAWYLCLCHYEGVWHPLAIVDGGEVIGHVMWGLDPDEGSYWIGGLVIAAERQRRGYGRAAVTSLIGRLREQGAMQAGISYHAGNARARALYLSLGFRETGERSEGEVVGRLGLR